MPSVFVPVSLRRRSRRRRIRHRRLTDFHRDQLSQRFPGQETPRFTIERDRDAVAFAARQGTVSFAHRLHRQFDRVHWLTILFRKWIVRPAPHGVGFAIWISDACIRD